MKKQFLSFTSVALLLSLVMLSSCKKDEEATKNYANVLVTHASPDAPGVDLLISDAKQNTSALNYPLNTGYIQVEAGTRNIKVNVAGTPTSVINADLTLEKDKNYSVFAIDSVSKLTDDLTAPASGKAHIRFIHLAPNSPQVDFSVVGGSVDFTNKSFKDYTAFTPVDAGTYSISVRLTQTQSFFAALQGINLQAGKIYTVFTKGLIGATGAQTLGAEIIVNK